MKRMTNITLFNTITYISIDTHNRTLELREFFLNGHTLIRLSEDSEGLGDVKRF